MAVVTKKGSSKTAGKTGATKTRSKPTLSLPTEKTKPSDRFEDYTTLIYGAKKIGKTSLVGQFDNCFMMMFEPGGSALETYQKPVLTWPDFIGYLDLLEEDTFFKTVGIDTVDLAYDRCFKHVCKHLGVEHPNDENDFGKTWGQIEAEFIGQITRFFSLQGKGKVVISHSAEKEVKTRTGRKFNRIQPTMSNQAMRYLTGVVDNFFYYDYNGKNRELVIRGDDYISAGTRLQTHFLTPKGEQVQTISMGKSPAEAYANLMAAWNNKVKTVEAFPEASSK